MSSKTPEVNNSVKPLSSDITGVFTTASVKKIHAAISQELEAWKTLEAGLDGEDGILSNATVIDSCRKLRKVTEETIRDSFPLYRQLMTTIKPIESIAPQSKSLASKWLSAKTFLTRSKAADATGGASTVSPNSIGKAPMTEGERFTARLRERQKRLEYETGSEAYRASADREDVLKRMFGGDDISKRSRVSDTYDKLLIECVLSARTVQTDLRHLLDYSKSPQAFAHYMAGTLERARNDCFKIHQETAKSMKTSRLSDDADSDEDAKESDRDQAIRSFIRLAVRSGLAYEVVGSDLLDALTTPVDN